MSNPVSDRIDAVQRYVAAQSDPNDETRAALDAVLTDGVTSTSPFGQASGRSALLESLANPMTGPLFAQATWADPVEEGDTVSVTATMAPGAMIGGIAYTFSFDGAGISQISQRMLPAPPPPPTELKLTPEIGETIDGAFLNGTPVILAYVDGSGQAHLSPRGTTQLFSADQLAMWARDPEGGLVRALPANPKVTLMYRDQKTRTSYQFFGRASVVADEQARNLVYERSPEVERNFDTDRRGVAIVVDVDRVEGMAQGARINMVRGAGEPT